MMIEANHIGAFSLLARYAADRLRGHESDRRRPPASVCLVADGYEVLLKPMLMQFGARGGSSDPSNVKSVKHAKPGLRWSPI
ncbi:MAG: hypothetical protein WCJ64_11800 [Rhodospirillaceae bacterium]